MVAAVILNLGKCQ